MFSFSYFVLVNFDPTKGFIKADSKSTLTHFIMNHQELHALIQSCQAILTFLVNRGLLAARRRCSCGNRVPNRTRETLVTGLVQKFVEPGTTIISDKCSPYFNLNSIGYIHLMLTLTQAPTQTR